MTHLCCRKPERISHKTFTRSQKKRVKEREKDGLMNEGREEKTVMKALEEAIVSHAWRDKVLTLIKK